MQRDCVRVDLRGFPVAESERPLDALHGPPTDASWRRFCLRWRFCKGRRPFTTNAALPKHRHEAQTPEGSIQHFLKRYTEG